MDNNIFQLTSPKEICMCIFGARSNTTEEELSERVEIFKTQIPKRVVKGKTIDIASIPKELDAIDKIYQYIKDRGLREKFLAKELSFDDIVAQIESFVADPEKAYETMKRERETISQEERTNSTVHDTREAEVRTLNKQEAKASESAGIREDLYSPGLLCGHAKEDKEKPFVQLLRCRKENIVAHDYQFADRNYTIKKIGELVYMPSPAMEDSVSEYEITIRKGEKAETIRRFGEISFHKMSDPSYNALAFLQLLKLPNITDETLHGYIGSLEQEVDEQGELKDSYKLAHLPEAYTAVVIWEQLEKARGENQEVQGKEQTDSTRASGGEAR